MTSFFNETLPPSHRFYMNYNINKRSKCFKVYLDKLVNISDGIYHSINGNRFCFNKQKFSIYPMQYVSLWCG